LAGFEIWQGVILRSIPGVIVIQDSLINDLANYYFKPNQGWIIAAVVTGLYAVGTVGGVIGKRRAGVTIPRIPWGALPIVAVSVLAGVLRLAALDVVARGDRLEMAEQSGAAEMALHGRGSR